jgi:hypothetical protein
VLALAAQPKGTSEAATTAATLHDEGRKGRSRVEYIELFILLNFS